MSGTPLGFRFGVAFSFAGLHREKVRAIAEIVAAKLGRERVFFDDWYEAEILGPNMRVLLQRFYYEQSLMVVADLSDEYAGRPWCQAEAEAIDALRMSIDSARDETSRLRLLNVKLGDGRVPGILPNAGYLDAINKTNEQCAELILKRHALIEQRMAGKPAPALAQPVALPPILFFHPATNDDHYSRRERELAWLDDCVRDTRIRVATVTGQGGLGKTSLVGHWIGKHYGWRHRAFRGVFFYSFYSNRDPKAFFAAFLEFVCKVEGVALPKNTSFHHLAAAACRKWSYLVVLDGLEVLQHGEDDPHYGWIADGELTEFVARVGAEGTSLLVLTSRFPFPRITDENPAAACALNLLLLTNAEGGDLLTVCGLTDPRPRLEGYSELLGGHPLALRIFAGACREQPFDEAEKVSRDVRSSKDVETMPDPSQPGLSPEEKQKRRQRRQFYKLLRWFQQKLLPPKRRLLQLVALFRDPVRTNTLVALATGLEDMKRDFKHCDVARITGYLEQLCTQSLLHKETDGEFVRWTAHPIVRDVFREEALAAGDTIAKQFAEIVAGKSEHKHPKTIAEVLPIVESIEVLLAAGDIKTAVNLFSERLESGYAFRNIPAPVEGLRCARAFLEPPARRIAIGREIGDWKLGTFLNATALWASICGEMEGVVRKYEEANQIDREFKFWNNVSIGFQNIAEAHILCGSLKEAAVSASQALLYASACKPSEAPASSKPAHRRLGRHPRRDEVFAFPIETFHQADIDTDTFSRMLDRSFPAPDAGKFALPFTTPMDRNRFLRHSIGLTIDEEKVMRSRTYSAWALSLAGQLAAASHDFAAADTLERKNHSKNAALYSIRGIHWAHYRYWLGEADVARRQTEANRALCKKNAWNDDLARCNLLLGELDLHAGNHTAAARRIVNALRVFRNAQQNQDLPDTLLAMARVRRIAALAERVPANLATRAALTATTLSSDESAISYCEEALRLAARSGFLLKKCDALNFRSQLLRESGHPEKALADAREAHDIATRCEYYWGLHESLRQLRDTTKALIHTAEFREWDEAERDLTDRMKPKIEEALRINREHDLEMGKLYGKKVDEN